MDPKEDELINSIANRVLNLEDKASINQPCAINRVPPNIRQCKADAYDPKLLTIGPYHHGKASLQTMEEHKWRYLRDILARNISVPSGAMMISQVNITNEVKKLVAKTKDLVSRVRRCYPENTNALDDGEFVTMLVLDGCFILELLIKFFRRERDDPLFAVAWILPLIRSDVLKLENQVPFFVLERLFDLIEKPTYRSRSGEMLDLPSLREISYAYLTWKKCEDNSTLQNLEIHHLLHLYDLLLLPKPNIQPLPTKFSKSKKVRLLPLFQSSHPVSDSSSNSSKNGIASVRPTSTIPSATELQEAGVIFKCREVDSFIDVEFRNGVIELPHLSVVDATDSVFRNLIAFEQSYPDNVTGPMKHFTSYALLLDCLVNTPRDVAILEENGIIENKLGSEEEVAALLNSICKEIIINYNSHHFAEMFERVNKYCGSKWNKHQAMLRRDYFRNPWTSISVAAAGVLLALTFVQTVFSGLSYSFKR